MARAPAGAGDILRLCLGAIATPDGKYSMHKDEAARLACVDCIGNVVQAAAFAWHVRASGRNGLVGPAHHACASMVARVRVIVWVHVSV